MQKTTIIFIFYLVVSKIMRTFAPDLRNQSGAFYF